MVIEIALPGSTTQRKTMKFATATSQISGGAATTDGAAVINTTSAIDAIRFNSNSGSVTSMIVIVEGRRTAGLVRTITEKTASFSFDATQFEGVTEINSGSAVVGTIPANATTALPLNEFCNITRLGAGAATITAASGVTLNGISAGSAEITSQYDGVVIRQRATDVWIIQGGTSGVI